MNNDTIAAISTAPGEAGISIVRISGPDSLSIADKLFRSSGNMPSSIEGGTFRHGFIKTNDGQNIDLDEVILLIYRAPASYTREDVAEIQCHGGRTSAGRILQATYAAGARPAEPGEFTRRAFLNGRLDLIQAEAVCDLIQASSDRAAQAAVEQLEGRLSDSISESYTYLMTLAADIEASLDFGDDELDPASFTRMADELKQAKKSIEDLLSTWEEGHILRDGALVVIAGMPNTGKSTLLNRLLGKNRAIVTDIPGTTRDTIEELAVINGYPIRLVDTAGLRDADCTIEQEGITRARSYLNRADLVLLVVDGSQPADMNQQPSPLSLTPDKTIILLNKNDVGICSTPDDYPGFTSISCSLLGSCALHDLNKAIMTKLHTTESGPPHAVISARHRTLLIQALDKLNAAAPIINEHREDEFVLAASDLREAAEALGSITGKVYSNELLDTIFNRFCIGK